MGDTGDHHFPKSHISSELNPNNLEGIPAINGDMFLSEIAEEDSISMMSDRNLANNNKQRQNVKPQNGERKQSTISLHSNFANL